MILKVKLIKYCLKLLHINNNKLPIMDSLMYPTYYENANLPYWQDPY